MVVTLFLEGYRKTKNGLVRTAGHLTEVRTWNMNLGRTAGSNNADISLT